jgi:1,4-alpha-glucan branching enzyme
MTSRAEQSAAAPVSVGELDRLLAGVHHDPHAVLGAHPYDGAITVRALRPMAASVSVLLPDGRRFPMEHEHTGIFTAVLPADAAASR